MRLLGADGLARPRDLGLKLSDVKRQFIHAPTIQNRWVEALFSLQG